MKKVLIQVILIIVFAAGFYIIMGSLFVKSPKPIERHQKTSKVAADTSYGLYIVGNPDSKKDTSFNQSFWYDYRHQDYHLQTYIITEHGQSHPKNNESYVMTLPDTYSPYFEEVHGTAAFIERQKENEMNKAKRFMALKIYEEKLIEDSLTHLRR